jgi:putative ABC transport system permease protein
VLTVALGIGANTAIFSLFDALVLRPIPAKDPARIVNIFRTVENQGRYGVFSYPEYLDYRDYNTAFSGLAAFTGARMSLGSFSQQNNDGTGDGETLQALLVSGNYFSVLGVGAMPGRSFVAEEDQTPNSHPVVVLSHDLWQRRFEGDPNPVGSTLILNAGIYAVMAYAVVQRTREIGIRMALGVQHKDVLGLVLRVGMRMVVTGVSIGLLAAIVGSRVLSKFLYGLSALDGLAFAGVSLLLAAMALLACWIPARRAIRIDPMVALHYE